MKVVAYLRVSTDRQAEEGNGLAVQRQRITKWAKRNGHRIVKWCSDEGISGTVDGVDRDGLRCVLDTIEGGRADGVVFTSLDRLARKLTVQEGALAHVWRAKGRAFAVDSGEILADDPDDPMRAAMRQMMGVFSQLERATISKRMRDGRRMKAERGGYAYGAPPLGYRASGGELVADEKEATTVGRIFELRAEGRSLREIVSVLEAEGHKTKRGGKWHPETLRLILNRQS